MLDKKSEYCENTLRLFSAQDSLSSKLLDYGLKTQELALFFQSKVIIDSCGKNYFVIPYSFHNEDGLEKNINISAFILKDCPNPNITNCPSFPPSIRFHLKGENIYIMFDESISLDSLEGYIKYRNKMVELLGEDDYYRNGYNHISLLLYDDIIKKETIELIIEKAFKVHLNTVKEKSKKLYNKNLCYLNSEELYALKTKYPFEIELVFWSDYFLKG